MRHQLGFLLGSLLGTTLLAGSAHAACNLISGTANTFNGTLGATNRPFAAPGERLEVTLRECDVRSPGLTPNATDHLVTVVFQPPSGPRTAVVLTAAPSCNGMTSSLAACAGKLGTAGGATCVAGANAGLAVVDHDGQRFVSFRFPDTRARCSGGANVDRLCTVGQSSDCPGGTCVPGDEDETLAGPAAIAVSAPGDPLPCGLATASCAGQSGLRACVDDLYANDGSCGTAVPLGRFPHFTALPSPNNFQTDCYKLSSTDDPPGPCNPTAANLRFGVDVTGNLLLPVAWQGILVPNAVPVPRLLRARFLSPLPFSVPDAVFSSSYTPEGGKLPPIFEPQVDPSVGNPDVVSLFGSADAPYTILRIGRRFGTCQGGGRDTLACNVNEDCLGGLCPTTCVGEPTTTCTTDADCGGNGPCGRLFDFSPLLGPGPLLLPRPQVTTPVTLPGMCQDTGASCTASCGVDGPCVNFAFEAESPVNLDSLRAKTAVLRGFTANEAVTAQDLNGDGDLFDTIASLRDRVTGVEQTLGAPAGCGVTKRALIRIQEPPFSFPAVEVDGDVLAFLESEIDQNRCIENGDEDNGDSLLRIVRLGAGETTYAGPTRAVDAAPKIDHRPLEISNGRVFVRSAEAAMAKQRTERVSVGPGGLEATGTSQSLALSQNGRVVAFSSLASNLLGPGNDNNFSRDVFVRDRDTGATERVSVGPGGVEANDHSAFSSNVAISGDGRFVAFDSFATNLGPGGPFNGASHVYVHDRQTGVNERVSVGPGGVPGDQTSDMPAISADGQIVAFRSFATNLIGPGADINNTGDVFVHDRQTGVTTRVSAGPGGADADNPSFAPAISADGRFVAFASVASNLICVECDSNGLFDIYVYDRQTGGLEEVSYCSGECETDGASTSPSLSADGRFVAFESTADNLAGGGSDTNGASDVYVRDLHTGRLDRVSVGPSSIQADSSSFSPSISADGRYVAFRSLATNLLGPGWDGNNSSDVLVHDRVTGVTERVSVGPGGVEANNDTFMPALSADGRVVAFYGMAANLLAPGEDTNNTNDVFVRAPDPADPLGIDPPLFADGALDDTVLEAIDAATGAVTTLCPSEDVAVAAGKAAFLRPEAPAGPPATPACPKGSLNGDVDTDDDVVQLWPGSGGVQNLHCAASAVTMSTVWIGALVSEAGEGADRNGDLDQTDTVVALHRVAGPFGTTCAGVGSQWVETQQAADTLEVSETSAIFITPEGAQGTSPSGLNADGDTDDRVLQVWTLDAGANTATPAPCTADGGASCTAGVRNAAEDFVVGEPALSACGPVHLVAIRTHEGAEGQNLNGDFDDNDDVMQVYDTVSGRLVNTGQAVTPCQLEACNPRQPYQVSGNTVKFLTLETQQGFQDLNDDGDNGDLILQSFDFCTDRVTVIGAVSTQKGQNPLDVDEESHAFFSPAGRCDLGVTCDPGNDLCGAGAMCEDDVCVATTGTCAKHTALSCADDADCRRCTLRQPGSCGNDADCPPGSTCQAQLIVAVASVTDTDDDGVPDAQDNCPTTPNTAQVDTDVDGVGDACDAQECGNGVQETNEACDDGNLIGGDGCSSRCTVDCTAAPVGGCRVAAQAQIQSIEKTPGKERLTLQWRQVASATAPADFGDPVGGTTSVLLCVYDDSASLVESLVVDRARNFCAGKPCWTAKGEKGWGFQDPRAVADGVVKLGFMGGAAGKGKADARAANNAIKGQTALPTGVAAALAGSSAPTIQMRTSDGLCLGATMTEVVKDGGGQYQARKR